MCQCMATMNRSMRPSLSKSKNLIPIAPHGALGKSRSVFSTLSSTLVLVVMAVPLHLQEKNVGPAVSIQIGEGRVAAPAVRVQPYVGGDVFEVVVPHVCKARCTHSALDAGARR